MLVAYCNLLLQEYYVFETHHLPFTDDVGQTSVIDPEMLVAYCKLL